MSDDRTRILDLLAAGKITAEEAARLLDALDATTAQAARAAQTAGADTSAEVGAETGTRSGFHKFFPGAKTTERTGAGTSGTPKFMYVKVVSVKGDNVNVKIPLALVRAGLKLTSLIPPQAQDQINKTMAEKGMSFDLNSFKPDDLEELIDALREMEVDVDSANGDKVHVYAA
jgi:hypothetical protein